MVLPVAEVAFRSLLLAASSLTLVLTLGTLLTLVAVVWARPAAETAAARQVSVSLLKWLTVAHLVDPVSWIGVWILAVRLRNYGPTAYASVAFTVSVFLIGNLALFLVLLHLVTEKGHVLPNRKGKYSEPLATDEENAFNWLEPMLSTQIAVHSEAANGWTLWSWKSLVCRANLCAVSLLRPGKAYCQLPAPDGAPCAHPMLHRACSAQLTCEVQIHRTAEAAAWRNCRSAEQRDSQRALHMLYQQAPSSYRRPQSLWTITGDPSPLLHSREEAAAAPLLPSKARRLPWPQAQPRRLLAHPGRFLRPSGISHVDMDVQARARLVPLRTAASLPAAGSMSMVVEEEQPASRPTPKRELARPTAAKQAQQEGITSQGPPALPGTPRMRRLLCATATSCPAGYGQDTSPTVDSPLRRCASVENLVNELMRSSVDLLTADGCSEGGRALGAATSRCHARSMSCC